VIKNLKRCLKIGFVAAVACSFIGVGQTSLSEPGSFDVLTEGKFVLANDDGSRLAVVLRNEIRILDGTSLLEERTFTLPASWMEFGLPSFSPDGQYLAAPVSGTSIMVWNLLTGTEAFSIDVSGLPYRRVFHSPSSDSMAVLAGQDIELRSAWTGQLIRVFDGHNDFVIAAAFSPDGTIMASSGSDGVIRLWDVAAGNEIGQLLGHESEANTLSFDPSGEQLVSSSGDGIVRIWDVLSGQTLHVIAAHAERVTWFSLNKDGSILATGSADATVRLWDMLTGANIATLDVWEQLGSLDGSLPIGIDPRSAAQVTAVDFGADDRYLAVSYICGYSSVIALWNLEGVL